MVTTTGIMVTTMACITDIMAIIHTLFSQLKGNTMDIMDNTECITDIMEHTTEDITDIQPIIVTGQPTQVTTKNRKSKIWPIDGSGFIFLWFFIQIPVDLATFGYKKYSEPLISRCEQKNLAKY